MRLFVTSLVVLTAGAVISLARGTSRRANAVGAWTALAGCLLGLGSLAAGSWSSATVLELPWGLPFGALRLGLDPLTRIFLLPVFVLGAACALSGRSALSHHHEDHNLGAHWFFFNMLLAAMALTLAARDIVVFLIAWEMMSLAPFFCISLYDNEVQVRDGAWVYLVASHLGAVFVLIACVKLWLAGASTDFSVLALMGGGPGPAGAPLLFVLVLIGFGAKAGIMPMHVWLPAAHPVAPSHVSAFLSGAMINAGIYGLVRFLGFLGPGEPWWGWTLLGLGIGSALLGALAALGQRNIKRLLAYSSVENMGLVAAGLGAWLVGAKADNAWIAVFGLSGALFHVLNHAAFKGLLFLGAGEILHAAGTIRLEHLGGLQKRLQKTGTLFLVGVLGITALPPFSGLASEFLLYLGLARGGDLPGLLEQMGLLGALAGLAATGGLVLFIFAKAYGLAFLGEPRSGAAREAHEPGWPALIPLAVLAAAVTATGLFAPVVYSLIAPAVSLAGGISSVAAQEAVSQAAGYLCALSATGAGLAVLVAVLAFARRRLLAGRQVRQQRTWDCGYVAASPRMQYGGASFAEPMAKGLGDAMGLSAKLPVISGYFPAKAALEVSLGDRLEAKVFTPLFEAAARVCDAAKCLQHGRIHLYILYILAVLVGLLFWKL